MIYGPPDTFLSPYTTTHRGPRPSVPHGAVNKAAQRSVGLGKGPKCNKRSPPFSHHGEGSESISSGLAAVVKALHLQSKTLGEVVAWMGRMNIHGAFTTAPSQSSPALQVSGKVAAAKAAVTRDPTEVPNISSVMKASNA